MSEKPDSHKKDKCQSPRLSRIQILAIGVCLVGATVVCGQTPKVVHDETRHRITAVYSLLPDAFGCSNLDATQGSVVFVGKKIKDADEWYQVTLLSKRGRQTFDDIDLSHLSLADKQLLIQSLLFRGKKIRIEYEVCGTGAFEYVQNIISLDNSFQANPKIPVSRPVQSLYDFEGKLPFDLLRARPQLKQRLRKLLGKDYPFFITAMTVQTPIELVGQTLVMSGCYPHMCSSHQSIMVINLNNGTIHCAIVSVDYAQGYKIFSEDRAGLPSSLMQKIHRL